MSIQVWIYVLLRCRPASWLLSPTSKTRSVNTVCFLAFRKV
jgi:hypothetical protein